MNDILSRLAADPNLALGFRRAIDPAKKNADGAGGEVTHQVSMRNDAGSAAAIPSNGASPTRERGAETAEGSR